jgi:hypothetical protein
VPPDNVWCARTVQLKPTTLGFFQVPSAIIHRTVRCATELSSAPTEQRLTHTTVDSAKATVREQCRTEVRAEVRGAPNIEQDLSGVAPDCLVPHEDKASNGQLLPNPNGWVTWRRTGQSTGPVRWCTGLSGAPIDSSLPQRLVGG